MTGSETIGALISALYRMDVDAFAGLLGEDVVVEHIPRPDDRGKKAVIEWWPEEGRAVAAANAPSTD